MKRGRVTRLFLSSRDKERIAEHKERLSDALQRFSVSKPSTLSLFYKRLTNPPLVDRRPAFAGSASEEDRTQCGTIESGIGKQGTSRLFGRPLPPRVDHETY